MMENELSKKSLARIPNVPVITNLPGELPNPARQLLNQGTRILAESAYEAFRDFGRKPDSPADAINEMLEIKDDIGRRIGEKTCEAIDRAEEKIEAKIDSVGEKLSDATDKVCEVLENIFSFFGR